MKALIQRVNSASVAVNDEVVSSIGHGMLVFLGVAQHDSDSDLDKLSSKLLSLRIFKDEQKKMNKSVAQVRGEILLVSQFTLLSNSKKGNRPSFIDAADPEKANKYYEQMKKTLSESVPVKTGIFGEYMQVSLVNDGPVTIMLDTRDL